MILSNLKVHKAIDDGRLVITPEPLPRQASEGKDSPYDTHAVNLRLGNELSVPVSGTFNIDLTQPGQVSDFLRRNSERVTMTARSGFPLKKNEFVLGMTLERVALPVNVPANVQLSRCLAARIEGKSSRARCGLLVHFTAPTVHPGFSGNLTLEMINLGFAPILLYPGMYIAQLIVEEVDGLPFENPSQFQEQTTPEGCSK